MKKRIILAKIETENIYYVPYGLLYVASALRGCGYIVQIIHCRENELNIFEDTLRKHSKDILFVGFSCLTGPPISPTLKASYLAKKKGIPVIWGGVHATILPEMCLNDDNIDFVVIGEGEETVSELAHGLEVETYDFSSIKGIGFKKNNQIIINPPRQFIENIDKYFPSYNLINFKNYYRKDFGKERVSPIISSRGCPHNCGFCYINAVHKNKWRAHSIRFVLEQIEYLKKNYDIDGVYWHDDNFFVDKKRGMEIIERVKLPCFGEIRADYITQDFAKWLRGTEFKAIFIGAESGANRILELVDKGEKKEDVINAVQCLRNSGISVELSFIVGFPTETKEEKKQTLRFISELKKINSNITLDLKIYNPYPKTPLWPIAVKSGLKPPETNKEWANLDRNKCILPWENCRTLERLCRDAQLYFGVLYNDKHLVWRLFSWLEKIRWRYYIFAFPIEFIITNWFYARVAHIKRILGSRISK